MIEDNENGRENSSKCVNEKDFIKVFGFLIFRVQISAEIRYE